MKKHAFRSLLKCIIIFFQIPCMCRSEYNNQCSERLHIGVGKVCIVWSLLCSSVCSSVDFYCVWICLCEGDWTWHVWICTISCPLMSTSMQNIMIIDKDPSSHHSKVSVEPEHLHVVYSAYISLNLFPSPLPRLFLFFPSSSFSSFVQSSISHLISFLILFLFSLTLLSSSYLYHHFHQISITFWTCWVQIISKMDNSAMVISSEVNCYTVCFHNTLVSIVYTYRSKYSQTLKIVIKTSAMQTCVCRPLYRGWRCFLCSNLWTECWWVPLRSLA